MSGFESWLEAICTCLKHFWHISGYYACSLSATSDDGLLPELQQVVIEAITAEPWMVACVEQASWQFLAPHGRDPSNCYNANVNIATATRETTFGACALMPDNSIDLQTFTVGSSWYYLHGSILAGALARWSKS